MHTPALLDRRHGHWGSHGNFSLFTHFGLKVVAKNIRGYAPETAATGRVKVAIQLRLCHNESRVEPALKWRG